jgi:hypothetical protein
MATQAAAVDLLMNKGEFEPQVALAIAEAVAVTMAGMEVVTVPLLDARMAVLDHKLDLAESRLDKKIDLVESRLEKKIELVESRLERKIDLIRLEIDNKLEVVRSEIEMAKAEMENKIDVAVARLERLNEATKSELVRWVFVAMVGSVFLQGIAAAIVNALMRHGT